MKTLRELKAFLIRGNIVDLAVAVALAGAFGAIVASMVNDLVMPGIAALFGIPKFTDLVYNLNGTDILYGNFIQAVVNFLIVGVFLFFVIKGVARLQKAKEAAPAMPSKTEVLLEEIRDLLKKD
ncbi:MAG: large conductance mechanosensitive channel protein MscL [Erysipelotrichaceae bacterium]